MSAPLHPSADEARRLLQQELAKGEYQSAKPGLFDRLAQSFWDWVQSLKFASTSGTPTLALIVLLVVIVAGIVVVFIIYGVPKLNRRSTEAADLFGSDDTRHAADLRASAARAAASGDFTTAIAELFRAIARSLGERGILSTPPGTTAHAIGWRAAALFPAQAEQLRSAASAFDDVRYLDRVGSQAAYDDVLALDATLERATPVGTTTALEGAGATAGVEPR